MSAAADFNLHRPRLVGLAYRMLGSLSEADDIAQDAWLRWSAVDPATIRDPAGWLVRTATRLCLDRLRAAKRRREVYLGPWLPEPLVEPIEADPLERAEAVSVAFLLALQRLSPMERAVFLLHDIFEQDYASVAETLGRAEPACRQLSSRARAHLKAAQPRFSPSTEDITRLAAAFTNAAANNDLAALAALLSEDCVMITDGGGKRAAALRPLAGREDILDFLRRIATRQTWPPAGAVRAARINGLPGLVVAAPDGIQTIALARGDDGLVSAIYIMRNPDKLRHVLL